MIPHPNLLIARLTDGNLKSANVPIKLEYINRTIQDGILLPLQKIKDVIRKNNTNKNYTSV